MEGTDTLITSDSLLKQDRYLKGSRSVPLLGRGLTMTQDVLREGSGSRVGTG